MRHPWTTQRSIRRFGRAFRRVRLRCRWSRSGACGLGGFCDRNWQDCVYWPYPNWCELDSK